MPDIYMSKAGYDKLVKEFDDLKKRKQDLSLEIGETREQGDLRENAGYQYAREKQSETIRRIAEIADRINSAKIIDDLNLPKDQVIIGTKILIKDLSDNEEYEYTLVGPDEADAAKGKISVHAPMAQGLLGHKINEDVTVPLPSGPSTFRILKIEFAL